MIWDFKNFEIWEFVDEKTYNIYGNRSTWFINPTVPSFLQKIRDEFNRPVIVNTWHDGGNLQYRGYRPPDCEIGARQSQHKLGNAADWHMPGIDIEELKDWLIRNRNFKFPELSAICLNTDDFIHTDHRWNFTNKLYKFSYL